MKELDVDSQTLKAWLTASPVTDGLSAEEIARIAPLITVKAFADDEVIGAIGESVTEFWVIGEGVVEAFYEDLHGQANWLGSAGPGDSLGEVTLVERTPRPVRLVAQTPGKLLSVPDTVFHDLLETYRRRRLYRNRSFDS